MTDERTSPIPPAGVDPSKRPITGLFEDQYRLGESLNVMVNGVKVYGELLTYGALDPNAPGPGHNKSRWFFFTDNWCAVNGYVSGFLFEGRGRNYPTGIDNEKDPFGRIVGQQNAIGVYRLFRSNGGYRLQVEPFGEDAIAADTLYTQDFLMETLIFKPE